jgi:hypothetical protein
MLLNDKMQEVALFHSQEPLDFYIRASGLSAVPQSCALYSGPISARTDPDQPDAHEAQLGGVEARMLFDVYTIPPSD